MCSDWKFLCSKTDIDDPFYLQISPTVSTLSTQKCAQQDEKKTLFKVENKTPAWNQKLAVKIACCESLFAAWEVNGGKKVNIFRVIYIWEIYEPFLVFRCRCSSNSPWHKNSPLRYFSLTMDEVYMIHDEILMQSVWRVKGKGSIVWSETHLTLNEALTTLILVIWKLIRVWTWTFTLYCISHKSWTKGFITSCKNIHQTRPEGKISLLHIAARKSSFKFAVPASPVSRPFPHHIATN